MSCQRKQLIADAGWTAGGEALAIIVFKCSHFKDSLACFNWISSEERSKALTQIVLITSISSSLKVFAKSLLIKRLSRYKI